MFKMKKFTKEQKKLFLKEIGEELTDEMADYGANFMYWDWYSHNKKLSEKFIEVFQDWVGHLYHHFKSCPKNLL